MAFGVRKGLLLNTITSDSYETTRGNTKSLGTESFRCARQSFMSPEESDELSSNEFMFSFEEGNFVIYAKDPESNLFKIVVNQNTPVPPSPSPIMYPAFSGYGNNKKNPQFGSSFQPLLRNSGTYYSANFGLAVRGSTPSNSPNPRVVSNAICSQTSVIPNTSRLTDMWWVFGQFIDHELDLTPGQEEHPETAPMATEASDPNEAYPGRTIPFTRSIFSVIQNNREQVNNISSFIDGTNIYGSSDKRALCLRRLDGTGKLKTSLSANGEVLMPYNSAVPPLENENGPHSPDPSTMFLGGDVRANENVYLIAMHTLWVREHNRICDTLGPELDEETRFQTARKMTTAFVQNIVYSEFLPAFLGPNVFGPYLGYDDTIDAGIATEFSTVGYRVGHTMLSTTLNAGSLGTVMLRDIFFTTTPVHQNGVNQYLRGAASKLAQEVDGKIIDDVRNLLFGPPTATMLMDLAAINMQRGRDHGIGGYNTLRIAYGLPRITSFTSFPTSSENRTLLQTLYEHPDYVDPWLGAIVETHLPGAAVGPLISAILFDQFERLRRGDRFYFENDSFFTEDQVTEIKNTKLSDVIRRNCNVTVQNNAFKL